MKVYSLKEYIKGEISPHYSKVLSRVRKDPIKNFLLHYRIAYILHRKKSKFLKKIARRIKVKIFYKFSVDIHLDAEIDIGFTPWHLAGIVIGYCKIGKNCSLRHQVTLGGRGEGGYPELGDNVFIGVGAKILGNVKIGNNVKIGAMSLVVKDCDKNSTYVGIPAKKVNKKIYKNSINKF